MVTRRKRVRKRPRRSMKGGGHTAVVVQLFPGAGFFTTFFYTCQVYMYAKEKNWPFFLEYKNWQYTVKEGWHDYFTTLTDFNTVDKRQFTKIKRYRHAEAADLPKYSIRQYIDCIKEIFVLKPELQERVDDYVTSIGGDYTSLYVRRGDKVIEAKELPSIKDILSRTDIEDDGRKLYVQTDDYRVIDELKELLPSCEIFTTTPVTSHGSNNQEMRDWTREAIKKDTEELLVGVCIFVRCKKGWSYYLSNVGAFHKLFGYDVVNLYNDSSIDSNTINKRYELNAVRNPYEVYSS